MYINFWKSYSPLDYIRLDFFAMRFTNRIVNIV